MGAMKGLKALQEIAHGWEGWRSSHVVPHED